MLERVKDFPSVERYIQIAPYRARMSETRFDKLNKLFGSKGEALESTRIKFGFHLQEHRNAWEEHENAWKQAMRGQYDSES